MKKAISFVLVAFLILLGLVKTDVVSAQYKDTGSNQYSWSHYGTSWQCVPLYCNAGGAPVEVWVLTDWHCVCHYINEQQTYMLMRWRGSFEYDGVMYDINDQITYGKNEGSDWNDPAYYDVKFVSNVKGSDGSHLVASGVFTMYDTNWNWVGAFDYFKFVSKQSE
jgi:hypothetical protein